jgi:hypothetical protein
MIFKPENLRKMPADGPTTLRADRGMTLILIKATGTVNFSHSCKGKDEIVRRFVDATDLLLLAWTGQWTGQWTTDIFRLTRTDLDLRYH